MIWRLRVIGTLAGVALLLGACGGSGGGDNAAASTGNGGGGDDSQQTAFRDCLKEQGVELPEGAFNGPGSGQRPSIPEGERPTFPEGGRPSFPAGGKDGGGFPGISVPGVSNEKLQDAFAACRDKMPNGGGFGGGGAGGQQMQAYLSCLRDHNVSVPTTPANTDGGPPAGGAGFGNFQDDPNFAAANKTCQALLPARNGTTTTTTTAPTG